MLTIARFDPRYGAPYEARFDPRNATSHRSRWRRRLVVGPLRRGARVSTRVGRRLLSRWGASTRSVDPDAEGCDVSDFAAGGCWPVAPAADEAYCAARPAGCVGVAQRGVGAVSYTHLTLPTKA